jgi:glucose-1-phosphatase
MPLKAVIFDVGGVLLRTEEQTLRKKWEHQLGLKLGEASHIVFNSDMGQAAQLGRVSDAALWKWIQAHLGLNPENLAAFKRDFFAHDRLDTELLAYIDRLRTRYTVGLLSNATDVARELFTETHPIASHFDSLTISAEEGIMKPDPRIFHTALVRAGVTPEEGLFVDDFIENVAGARQTGMAAIHFTDPDAARKDLVAKTSVR